MNTLTKAFRIIEEIVSHQESGLLFSEVVALTEVPKASAHRILKTLVNMGYLRFDTITGKYRGDLKLSSLGSEVMTHFDLKDYVRPHLMELHSETQHTCHLGVSNGNMGVYLDKLESRDYGIKLFSAVGRSFPLHCTALGKVLLAFMDKESRKAVLRRKLESFTNNTITDAAVLERELDMIRERKCGVDREEITRGIICVAAPVFDAEGDVIAGISLSFPSYIEDERGIDSEIEAVKRCSSAILSMFRERRESGEGGGTD